MILLLQNRRAAWLSLLLSGKLRSIDRAAQSNAAACQGMRLCSGLSEGDRDESMSRRLLFAGLAILTLTIIGRPAAAQDMLTVGELLQHCHANSTVCAQDFGSSSISMAFLWGGNCIPPKLVRQQVDIAILRWLIAHPELAGEDAPDGIADAVAGLWPCATP